MAQQYIAEHRGRVLRSSVCENVCEVSWFAVKAMQQGVPLQEAETLARMHIARKTLGCSYARELQDRVDSIVEGGLYEASAAAPTNSVKPDEAACKTDRVTRSRKTNQRTRKNVPACAQPTLPGRC